MPKTDRKLPRGIGVRTLSDGRKTYHVRVYLDGKERFIGGLRTQKAAETALGELRRQLERAHIGIPEPVAPNDPTFRELAGDPDAVDGQAKGTYLAWLKMPNNKALNYVRRVETALRSLLPFFGSCHISELNKDLVAQYQQKRLTSTLRVGEKAKLAAKARRGNNDDTPGRQKRAKDATPPRTVGPACVNRELLTLRACLSWAADDQRDPARRIARNPLTRLTMLQEPEPRNPTLSIEAERTLLDACHPPWMRDLVTFLLGTGMRPGEALALRFRDLNPDQGLATVRVAKNNRSRLVPVPRRVMEMILARRPKKDDGTPNDDAPVFQSSRGNSISSGKAAHTFTPIARGLGLDFTLHSCRHIWASRALSMGATLPQIAAVLGHRNLASATMRYTHARLPDLQSISEAVAAMADREPKDKPQVAGGGREGESTS